MRRRDFLTSLAAAGLATLPGCGSGKPPLPPGEMPGPSMDFGHLLREPGLPPPSETRRVPVVIVGGGIGGLSAGWKLAKSGYKDFLLVELESALGGNSRSGRNEVSEYPLAAHYLPLPTMESTAVRELLADLGVLQGDPRAVAPHYDERYLCAVPQERLYRNGWWQEGLLPQMGVSAAEHEQYQRFHALMESFKQRRDGGARAFAIPMTLSSRAPDLLALDKLSMRDWMMAQGFDSPHLHWYVDYACRDDFGTSSKAVSAWVGIHYFACRNGEAKEVTGDAVLTTPGGNAWLVEGMAQSIRERAGDRVMTGALAFRVADDVGKSRGKMWIDLWLPDEKRTLRLETDQLIWAAPLFLVPYVFAGYDALKTAARSFSYAPWIVANLTLSRFPENRAGVSTAWDNVLYDSPGLGYVVATHQQMRVSPGKTVLTYYRALVDKTPQLRRMDLEIMPRQGWAEEILADLERAHPDIRQVTTRLDVARHGHAMTRPTTGLMWSEARKLFTMDRERLRFAHSDVSGFSLFEEAQYWGVLAAERTLKRLGKRFVTSLV